MPRQQWPSDSDRVAPQADHEFHFHTFSVTFQIFVAEGLAAYYHGNSLSDLHDSVAGTFSLNTDLLCSVLFHFFAEQFTFRFGVVPNKSRLLSIEKEGKFMIAAASA